MDKGWGKYSRGGNIRRLEHFKRGEGGRVGGDSTRIKDIYIIKLFTHYIYIYMLAIAGQTAEPNRPDFFFKKPIYIGGNIG